MKKYIYIEMGKISDICVSKVEDEGAVLGGSRTFCFPQMVRNIFTPFDQTTLTYLSIFSFSNNLRLGIISNL